MNNPVNTLKALVVWYETHLITSLAFCTKICEAELHGDCMPFKKGQINIALLSRENTAVLPVFMLSSSCFDVKLMYILIHKQHIEKCFYSVENIPFWSYEL